MNLRFELIKLPYALNALEPVISAETMDYHYNHHLRGYIDKANILFKEVVNKGSISENSTLEDIIKSKGPAAHAGYEDWGLYNQATQVWNHYHFFNSLKMKPFGYNRPTGKILELISKRFGGFDRFREEFSKYANDLFGSGYTWLCKDLRIVNLQNANNPLSYGQIPILCIDVFEHSYYIDRRNRRDEYIKEIWDVINWDRVEERLLR